MAWFFKRRGSNPDALHAIYTDLVSRARNPVFFADWGVPDTVTGRFDMITLHMALIFHRLSGEGERASQFSQDLFDLFFRDMDRNLREMGVGDLSVPKRIGKMGSVFFGLAEAIGKALADPEPQVLVGVLERNQLSSAGHEGANQLAGYVRTEFDRLKSIPASRLMAGITEPA